MNVLQFNCYSAAKHLQGQEETEKLGDRLLEMTDRVRFPIPLPSLLTLHPHFLPCSLSPAFSLSLPLCLPLKSS